MSIHTIFLVIILQIVSRFGEARPIPVYRHPTLVPNEQSATKINVQIERSNSTNNVQIERSNSTNNVQIERSNTTKNGSNDALEQQGMFGELRTAVFPIIRHIAREKRQTPIVPKDFDEVHEPCELDFYGYSLLKLSTHCRYAHSNRFTSEEFWMLFRLYGLEGFMFGQHYERFKRYETEQHTFEYRYSRS